MDIRTYLASPRASVGVVDVRDVARAHVIAMREPQSDGQRILVTAQPSVWFGDMAQWLAEEFRPQGKERNLACSLFRLPNNVCARA